MKLIPVLVAATLAGVAAPASAEDAPVELRNKTIVLSWVVHRVVMTPLGERTPVIHVARMIYISSLGRPFVKSRIDGPRGTRDLEIAPGDSTARGGAREVDFAGNTIVAMAQNGTGAGRMVVTFDQSFTTCHVDAEIARPSGGRLMKRGSGGGMVEILSNEFSDQSCEIRDGNLVAP